MTGYPTRQGGISASDSGVQPADGHDKPHFSWAVGDGNALTRRYLTGRDDRPGGFAGDCQAVR